MSNAHIFYPNAHIFYLNSYIVLLIIFYPFHRCCILHTVVFVHHCLKVVQFCPVINDRYLLLLLLLNVNQHHKCLKPKSISNLSKWYSQLQSWFLFCSSLRKNKNIKASLFANFLFYSKITVFYFCNHNRIKSLILFFVSLLVITFIYFRILFPVSTYLDLKKKKTIWFRKT